MPLQGQQDMALSVTTQLATTVPPGPVAAAMMTQLGTCETHDLMHAMYIEFFQNHPFMQCILHTPYTHPTHIHVGEWQVATRSHSTASLLSALEAAAAAHTSPVGPEACRALYQLGRYCDALHGSVQQTQRSEEYLQAKAVMASKTAALQDIEVCEFWHPVWCFIRRLHCFMR